MRIKLPEYTNQDAEDAIDQVVHSERDRRILKGFYLDGYAACELADIHHLTERRIWQIIKKHRAAVFRYAEIHKSSY